MSNELHAFIAERLGTSEAAEPAAVVAERQRQDALKARAEHLNNWKRWNAKGHQAIDHPDKSGWFAVLREDCGLSQGDVAEITGTSPNSVADYEAGKDSYATPAYEHLLESMHAALDRQE